MHVLLRSKSKYLLAESFILPLLLCSSSCKTFIHLHIQCIGFWLAVHLLNKFSNIVSYQLVASGLHMLSCYFFVFELRTCKCRESDILPAE